MSEWHAYFLRMYFCWEGGGGWLCIIKLLHQNTLYTVWNIAKEDLK